MSNQHKDIKCEQCKQETVHDFVKLISRFDSYQGEMFFSVWSCVRCTKETSLFEYTIGGE